LENTELNITEVISGVINSLLESLFNSIDSNLFTILDDITFLNTDILKTDSFEKILGTSSVSGILLVANSLLIGFILYYSLKLLLSNFTYIDMERPYQFIFKLILCTIFMNFSFFLCEQFINLIWLVSSSIRNIGENLFNTNICFYELIEVMNQNLITDFSFNIFSLDGLIKTILSVGLLNLVFTYSLRYIMIKVFILLLPFSILSLSSNSTAWIFKVWIRSFFSLLFIQVFIAIILLIIFSINLHSSDLLSKIISVGSIYALIKGNSYVRELFGGISTDVQINLNSMKSMMR